MELSPVVPEIAAFIPEREPGRSMLVVRVADLIRRLEEKGFAPGPED